jgi:hypothetical protein
MITLATDCLREPRTVEQAAADLARERDLLTARRLIALHMANFRGAEVAERALEHVERRIAMLRENAHG